MKKWIKENMVLAIGLALPLLLILLFFLATVVPKSMGTPPQHELVFTTIKYDYQTKPDYLINFYIKNKQLMVKAKKIDDKNNYNAGSRRLMAYNAKTEAVREIALDESKLVDGVEMVLEETKNLQLDTSLTSPDGYTLEGPHYNGGGLIGGIFGGGYRNSGFRIKKGGVGYKVPHYQPEYYYADLKFVGWVVSQ